MKNLSSATIVTWQIAAKEAGFARSRFIEPEHILIGICSLEKIIDDANSIPGLIQEKEYVQQVFQSINQDPPRLRHKVREKAIYGVYQAKENVIHRSSRCRKLFMRAEELHVKNFITCRELLIALLENPNEIILSSLNELNIDISDFLSQVISNKISETYPEYDFFEKTKENAMSTKTPLLNKYGRDLTQEARDGKLGELIGRRSEMLQVIQILTRLNKNNPVLVGEAGVGKTAIAEGLAQRIIQGKDAHVLGGKRLIELNISYLLSGSGFRGKFEERLNKVISEVQANPEIILFIDEIHTIVGAGQIGKSSLDAGNILKPALARGDFRCIGATTISEYRKYIESDRALERRFEIVMVFEPSRNETLEILEGIIPRLEEHHRAHFTSKALEAAVDLSIRFDTSHQLPDKAISLLDTAGSNAVVPNLSMIMSSDVDSQLNIDNFPSIDENAIASIVSRKTGIDIDIISPYIGKSYLDRIKQLTPFFENKIIGQDDAIKRVSDRLILAQSGLADESGPLATFLFTGPSGVGKTQFGLHLAEFLFGTSDSVIRLDMSEYKEEHSISKLIGSPPGYIGYEEEGQLTSKLRTHPYSVVLLDECEKAHPKVYDMFLQVFDAGRMTDSKGRTIDMRNTIFVMTSNISSIAPGSINKSDQVIEKETISMLSDYFRIEFLNRLDDIIVFKMLNEEDAMKILCHEIDKLTQKASEKYKIDLEFTDRAFDYLLHVGYSPQLGVRELNRTLEKLVHYPLSLAIAEGKSKARKWIFDAIDNRIELIS